VPHIYLIVAHDNHKGNLNLTCGYLHFPDVSLNLRRGQKQRIHPGYITTSGIFLGFVEGTLRLFIE